MDQSWTKDGKQGQLALTLRLGAPCVIQKQIGIEVADEPSIDNPASPGDGKASAGDSAPWDGSTWDRAPWGDQRNTPLPAAIAASAEGANQKPEDSSAGKDGAITTESGNPITTEDGRIISLEARGTSQSAGLARPLATRIELRPAAAEAHIEGHALNVTLTENLNAQDSFDATVIPGLWTSSGFSLFEIDRAEQELTAIRQLVVTMQAAAAADPKAHNHPPELLNAPEIDIEAIDGAIQCLRVLRVVMNQPQPDIEVLKLVWYALVTALRAIGRLIAWAGHLTKDAVGAFLKSAFGKGFLGMFGAKVAADVYPKIAEAIIKNGPSALQNLEHALKTVLTTLGHPL